MGFGLSAPRFNYATRVGADAPGRTPGRMETSVEERALIAERNRLLAAAGLVPPEAETTPDGRRPAFRPKTFTRAVAALEASLCRRCGGLVLGGGSKHRWRCTPCDYYKTNTL